MSSLFYLKIKTQDSMHIHHWNTVMWWTCCCYTVLNWTEVLTECCTATCQNRKIGNKQPFFYNRSWHYAVHLSLWAQGSVNGSMTMSITANYPCLITSVELDCSWEGFSATEKILRLRVGGGVLDGEQSCRAVVDSRVGGLRVSSSSSSFLSPSKNEPGTVGQLPKPPPDNNMGKKEAQLNRRGEKRKRVIRWPPLWECCKLCFPEALGIPHQSWNLRAWKTGPASPERGDVKCRATSLDYLVWGGWQWRTFSAAHQGASLTEQKYLYYNTEDKRFEWITEAANQLLHFALLLLWTKEILIS